jgi:hypothetical protein
MFEDVLDLVFRSGAGFRRPGQRQEPDTVSLQREGVQ